MSNREFTSEVQLAASRNFNVDVNGTETSVMVPFADMFNHAEKFNCHWFYDEFKGGFSVIADEDIEEDEELFDSYGEKPNYRFFLHYAFLFEDSNGENPQNEFPMKVDLEPEDI